MAAQDKDEPGLSPKGDTEGWWPWWGWEFRPVAPGPRTQGMSQGTEVPAAFVWCPQRTNRNPLPTTLDLKGTGEGSGFTMSLGEVPRRGGFAFRIHRTHTLVTVTRQLVAQN